MHTRHLVFWVLFAASLALFFAPLSEPGQVAGLGADKAVHAAIFFILAFAAWRAYPQSAVFSFALLACYTYAIEFIQGRYFPTRHFDWRDIAADLVGLALAMIIWRIRKNDQSA